MKTWPGKRPFDTEVRYLGKIELDILNLMDWAGSPHIEERDGEFVSSWHGIDIENDLVWLIAGSSSEPLGAGRRVASKVMTWDLYGQSTNYLDLCELSQLLLGPDYLPPIHFIELHDAD